ncbi:MAG: type III-B CRISPR module-associated protein Cmr5 [Aquificaceae bacterium]|jgi:CRISPR-associated protein Cmr5|uniref:type III-B CRISPR module-associated protein Cmr5 n=1 Tax=Hydrogenobacter sp. Uz 6-8 TaxID=3384828 RepID=UPI000F1250DE|nr:MAG: type III-B CRISPR module-associated protein Cmr5 [Aquificota bacterium]
MKSRLQQVAGLAYECVKGVKGKGFEGKYASHARKLPSMIVHNGLLTTCAFIRAKAKDDGWQEIENHIKLYLEKMEGKKVDSLVEFFAGLDFAQYRLYTQKILYFAQWLKRLAEGELKYEAEQD